MSKYKNFKKKLVLCQKDFQCHSSKRLGKFIGVLRNLVKKQIAQYVKINLIILARLESYLSAVIFFIQVALISGFKKKEHALFAKKRFGFLSDAFAYY